MRISFGLVQDEDGYPPADVETLWALVRHSEDGDDYEIDSIPFFVKDVSLGDRVRTQRRGTELWFDRVVRASKNSLLRIIVDSADRMQDIRERLRVEGCASELSHLSVLAAVDVPAHVDLDKVLDLLEKEDDIEVEIGALRHRSRRW